MTRNMENTPLLKLLQFVCSPEKEKAPLQSCSSSSGMHQGAQRNCSYIHQGRNISPRGESMAALICLCIPPMSSLAPKLFRPGRHNNGSVINLSRYVAIRPVRVALLHVDTIQYHCRIYLILLNRGVCTCSKNVPRLYFSPQN